MATDWHAQAHCGRCSWTYEERGTEANTTRASNAHMKDKEHAVHESLHRAFFCKTLGCPFPPEIASGATPLEPHA